MHHSGPGGRGWISTGQNAYCCAELMLKRRSQAFVCVGEDAMNCPRVCTVLAAILIAALPGAALAQFPPAPGSSTAPVQDRWPDPPKSPQAGAPAGPAAQAAPKRAAPAQAKTSPSGEELLDTPAKKPAAAAAAAPALTVACSGAFA